MKLTGASSSMSDRPSWPHRGFVPNCSAIAGKVALDRETMQSLCVA
jgi:hypothetical protein